MDIVDTALAPFALRSSQPAAEPIIVALEGTPWDTGLDLSKLLKMGEYLESIAPKYRDFMDTTKMSVIDTGVLKHQIPGGMISNMVSQLKQQKAVHRLEEVYAELPKARKDLGFPPLVTPTSQIVGVQSVLKRPFRPLQDGLHGNTGLCLRSLWKTARADQRRGQEGGAERVQEGKRADHVPAGGPDRTGAGEGKGRDERACEETSVIRSSTPSIPRQGVDFLKWKYGIEPTPEKVKPKTLDQVKKEDEAMAKAKAEAQKQIRRDLASDREDKEGRLSPPLFS